MEQFRVVEQFKSINGEGRRAGQLALFIRFAGCNLKCEYCDTKWANEENVPYIAYTIDEIYQVIKKSAIKNVTLTGGEPLIQPNMEQLLKKLRLDQTLRVEIETNGSIDIRPFLIENTDNENGLTVRNTERIDNISFTLDYKTTVSGMEEKMCLSNYENVRPQDTVKFVVGSREDLQIAKKIIEDYHLVDKGCGIYLSPCFGKIEAKDMVEFLLKHNMNDINIQLQLHKYIWNPEKRGV